MVKKNTKRLERFLGEARGATDDLKKAVAALEGLNFEDASSFVPARSAFLSNLSERFNTYIEKPVKGKTAMYHRVAKFLVAGATRIHKRARNTSPLHRQSMGKIIQTLKQSRALYEDYLVAHKSKAKHSQNVKKYAAQAIEALKP
jgi:hypothetical protein